MHVGNGSPPCSVFSPASGVGSICAAGDTQAGDSGLVDEKSLRILLIVEASAGGTGRHVLDLAEGYIKRGHRVHLVYSTIRIDRFFRDRSAEVEGLRRLALPIRRSPHPADYRIVRIIGKLKKEHGPFDIIHGHSSKGGALARLVAIGTRAKVFYTLHGLNSMDPGMSWFMRQVYLAIERVLALRTQGIIAVSPEEERAATFIGLGGAKIRTIPNGLDQLDLASRESARRAMGVNEGEIVVGFVGRLVEQKAPEVLIKAFANVSIAVPNARLAMVGDGPLFDHLVELSGQLGISQKVVWLGESDARQFFGGFDLFALPSRKEGLPYVILEAMATGLPVVATSSAGVEILIEPGINGLVVPPDDAGAFGEALVHLLQTPDLLTRYGAASLRLIRRFPIDRMVENTLSFYRSSASAPAHAEFETEEMAAV